LIDCWIVNIQRQICNTYAEREQVQQCLKIYIDIKVGWGQPDMGLQEGQIGTTQNDISPILENYENFGGDEVLSICISYDSPTLFV